MKGVYNVFFPCLMKSSDSIRILSLLEGLTRLLDNEKRQKRRGKEEDSDITGAYIPKIWQFF